VEEHLDEERRNSRLNNTRKTESLISSLSLLKNEIELDGRRLIVKPSLSKDKAGEIKVNQTLEQKKLKL